MKATEVFTPGSFPEHTYVKRDERELEEAVRDGIDTPGQIVSLAGPSKSGKTVLIENVVGNECLIPIQGTGIEKPAEIWSRVLDWIEAPSETTSGSSQKTGGQVDGQGKLFGVGVGAKGSHQRSSSSQETFGRRGMKQVIEEIGESDFVVLIDDFHYMDRSVQEEVAKGIKEAARLGINIVTAQVPHRGDDVVRANPELRGRVRAIDINYWNERELKRIEDLGFDALNVRLSEESIEELVKESAGSPQLMQLICLHTCFVLNIREAKSTTEDLEVGAKQAQEIFEQTASVTDFRSLVDVLDSGPKRRGTERNVYQLTNGEEGDVYRCLLHAIAADPPKLSFDYDEITERVNAMCSGDSPDGSSITRSCSQMGKLAQEKFPNERVIDWDETKQFLELPDPYLLFYLRWSERLT